MWWKLLLLVMFSIFFGGERAEAQQSFFNAFSGDRTTEHTHFFQTQTNLAGKDSVMNNTYDYGVTKNLEVGVNWLDLPILRNSHSVSDGQEIMANAQYFFQATEQLQLSAGLQAGRSDRRHGGQYAQLLYVNSQWKNEQGIKVVFGLLAGNNNYLEHERVIAQGGIEIPILRDKVHFVSDYITGDSENSVGVTGFVLPMTETFSLSVGYQYPAANTKNDHGFVFELTYAEPAS